MNHEDIYKPHANQLKLHLDRHRYRVVVAGRRFGKSAFGINEALVRILGKRRQLVWIILPTYKQAKEIYWVDPDVLQFFMPYVHAKILKKNDSELSLYCAQTESWIRLKGADQPDSLRGSGLDLIVWDEAAQIKPLAYETIKPSLADSPYHKAIFIGTPRGYNHFHDFALKGDHVGQFAKGDKKIAADSEWNSWHFTSYDNLTWKERSYERERFVAYLDKEKADSTPDWFAQEYMAQFTRFTGLIYKYFNENKHVEYFDHVVNQYGDYYFGQDFAVRGWNANLPIHVRSDGHIYFLDNYKKENDIAINHGANMIAMLKLYADLSRYTGYGDPAGFAKNQQGIRKGREMVWSLADEYIDQGFPLVPGNNEVVAGINYVNTLFSQDKIHIHPRCDDLIKELLQYKWLDQPENQIGEQNQPEKPRKFNDHLVDAMRYVLYSKPSAPEEEEQPRLTTFPSQFPPPKIEEEEKNDITPIDIPGFYD